MIKLVKTAAGVSLAILLSMAGVRAELLAHAVNNDGWEDFGPQEVAIPLTAAGKTTLNFTTTEPNTSVIIIYNAECAALGPPSSKFSIRITVDKKNTSPNPPDHNFAFCAATNNTNKVYTAVSRVVVYTVPAAGKHTVRVLGILPNGATFASVDDAILIVQK